MERFTAALDESIQRQFGGGMEGGAGETLDRVIVTGHYLERIPATQRARFRTQVLAAAVEAFTVGFTRRYTDAAPELLDHVWDQQAAALGGLIQRSVRVWDAELTRQGKPGNLQQRFPVQRLRKDLEAGLHTAFVAGQREGYRALKHRLAEDTRNGLSARESLRLLARGSAAILAGSPAAEVECTPAAPGTYAYR
ncbi:MAG TPA: hypothetical protein VEI97_11140 [bacterium]|nr:hypothetical protein [bacterium]